MFYLFIIGLWHNFIYIFNIYILIIACIILNNLICQIKIYFAESFFFNLCSFFHYLSEMEITWKILYQKLFFLYLILLNISFCKTKHFFDIFYQKLFKNLIIKHIILVNLRRKLIYYLILSRFSIFFSLLDILNNFLFVYLIILCLIRFIFFIIRIRGLILNLNKYFKYL
jgi:hypothetical protein